MMLVAELLLLGTLAASPAVAAEPACELHIWPSHASGATTAGVLSNLGPVGLYADYRSNRDATLHDQVALIEALPVTAQAQVIAALDLPRLLGMESATVTFQTGNINPRTAPKSSARLSRSDAACYAELVVTLNHYRNSAVRGASLRTDFTFRDFRSGKMKIVGGAEATGLKDFPARAPEQQSKASAAVAAAFAANLRSFAKRVDLRKR